MTGPSTLIDLSEVRKARAIKTDPSLAPMSRSHPSFCGLLLLKLSDLEKADPCRRNIPVYEDLCQMVLEEQREIERNRASAAPGWSRD